MRHIPYTAVVNVGEELATAASATATTMAISATTMEDSWFSGSGSGGGSSGGGQHAAATASVMSGSSQQHFGGGKVSGGGGIAGISGIVGTIVDGSIGVGSCGVRTTSTNNEFVRPTSDVRNISHNEQQHQQQNHHHLQLQHQSYQCNTVVDQHYINCRASSCTNSFNNNNDKVNMAVISNKLLCAGDQDNVDHNDDKQEVICSRSSGDKRSLFWSAAVGAGVTIVPSRHTNLAAAADKSAIRRRKNIFKRKRRPSLSKVVEIYENGGADGGRNRIIVIADTNQQRQGGSIGGVSGGSDVGSEGLKVGGASAGIGDSADGVVVGCDANGNDDGLVSASVRTNMTKINSVSLCDRVIPTPNTSSCATSAISATALARVNGNLPKCGEGSNRSSGCGANLDYCDLLSNVDSASTKKVTVSSSMSDSKYYAAAVDTACGTTINPIATRERCLTTSKSWYGSGSDSVTKSLNGGANDGEKYIWRCRRMFTSVPEDEYYDNDNDDKIREIDANCAERVVLLERSASMPDDEALSTPPAKRTTKAASMTLINDDVNVDVSTTTMAASFEELGNVKHSSRTATTLSSPPMAGSKLGKWSKSKIDLLVPSIKSLVTMTTSKLVASNKVSNLNCRRRSSSGSNNNNNNNKSFFTSSSASFSRFDVRAFESASSGNPGGCRDTLRRNISLNSMTTTGINGRRYEQLISSHENLAGMGALAKKLRKCNTMLTLSSGGCGINRNTSGCGAGTAGSSICVEPLRPVNRLRVSPSSQELYSLSRMCSRCSSLLSMASSSRYSLNSAYGFVPVSSLTVLCKVCLNEVPLKDSWTLQHCECSYCVDCVRSYVEFEINQGAYSISCPDAQCEKQGIIMLEEIESLVSLENVEKHIRYRLNREVEMDKSRTWCPRAGCETVCNLCSTDRCTPQSVHCPACNMEFCSNCRGAWHADSPCKSEEVVPGVTFDSELIKCCPMCSVPIEKDEGCAQMLCKRCKHVFCWYCLASLDDDFLLRHYDKGPCKNKLGHSRASVIWHRTQVISIFAGFGILLLIASPLLLLAAPCIVCCKCRVCSSDTKLDVDDDLPESAELQLPTNADPSAEKNADENLDTNATGS